MSLNDSFIYNIVGKPGSGKTTLVSELIMNDKCFKGTFHFIFWISPN